MIPKYCHRILLIQQQILRKRQWAHAVAIEIKALPRETYVQEHAKMIEIKRSNNLAHEVPDIPPISAMFRCR